MITPLIDLLCVGLLSIVAIGAALLFGVDNLKTDSLGYLIPVATLINGAHFMASYRLLYQSREQIMRYKSASIYVPALLLLYSVYALNRLVEVPDETYWFQGLLVAASLYLALHYTGQTWGMMSSFAYIEKAFFDQLEKRIFIYSLRLLVVWQVVWSVYLIQDLPGWLSDIRPILDPSTDTLAVLALFAGSYAFYRMKKRLGKAPPLRVLVPFYTLFAWYALLAIHPAALLGVQISHAVQYLVFPVRVELNRQQRALGDDHVHQRHLLAYCLALTFLSLVFFLFLPEMLKDGFSVYSQALIASINIHHFYTDGCIWKISSPVVRDDLFSHLSRGQ
ncbi:MAG: hypothetical protein J5J00_09520 [Deltaproteobacteria bacterium]|nr:hypothetical protein [Deltaproteobacteria bacterium]